MAVPLAICMVILSASVGLTSCWVPNWSPGNRVRSRKCQRPCYSNFLNKDIQRLSFGAVLFSLHYFNMMSICFNAAFSSFSSKMKAEAGMDRMTQRHMPWNPATWHRYRPPATWKSWNIKPQNEADPGRDLVPHRVASEPSHVLALPSRSKQHDRKS